MIFSFSSIVVVRIASQLAILKTQYFYNNVNNEILIFS